MSQILSSRSLDGDLSVSSSLWSTPLSSLRHLIKSSPSPYPHRDSKSSAMQSNINCNSNGPSASNPSALNQNSRSTPTRQPFIKPNRKPIKSAIRNSRTDNGNFHDPLQCIPQMGGAVSMPSGGGKASGPYISPQWGWYISTTPPTPEYHSSAGKDSLLSHQMNMNNPAQSSYYGNNFKQQQQWNPTTAPIQESPKPVPVFTKGTPNYSSGWPTVPL